MLGFGASITDSSSYVMTKYLTASALTETLEKLFDASKGAGLKLPSPADEGLRLLECRELLVRRRLR